MAIGGVRGTGPGGGNPQQGSATSTGQGAGKEFALEKQQTAMSDQAKANTAAGTALVRTKRSKTSKIVDRKKRNRRGSPRTVLVDGEIYEVFLLAIA